jgi:hypothetical protein
VRHSREWNNGVAAPLILIGSRCLRVVKLQVAAVLLAIYMELGAGWVPGSI